MVPSPAAAASLAQLTNSEFDNITTSVDVDDFFFPEDEDEQEIQAHGWLHMQVPDNTNVFGVRQNDIPNPKKSVGFSNVQVRVHTVVKGNHELAYPLSLGWNFVDQDTVLTVDDFEDSFRASTGKKQNQLRTTTEERRKIIKACVKLEKEWAKQSKNNDEAGGRMRRRKSSASLLLRPPPIGKSMPRRLSIGNLFGLAGGA